MLHYERTMFNVHLLLVFQHSIVMKRPVLLFRAFSWHIIQFMHIMGLLPIYHTERNDQVIKGLCLDRDYINYTSRVSQARRKDISLPQVVSEYQSIPFCLFSFRWLRHNSLIQSIPTFRYPNQIRAMSQYHPPKYLGHVQYTRTCRPAVLLDRWLVIASQGRARHSFTYPPGIWEYKWRASNGFNPPFYFLLFFLCSLVVGRRLLSHIQAKPSLCHPRPPSWLRAPPPAFPFPRKVQLLWLQCADWRKPKPVQNQLTPVS